MNSTGLVTRNIAIFIVFLVPTFIFAAPLYQPGETLNPSCLPSDVDCTVATSTASTSFATTTNDYWLTQQYSLPNLASVGSSTGVTYLNGNVGIGTTTSGAYNLLLSRGTGSATANIQTFDAAGEAAINLENSVRRWKIKATTAVSDSFVIRDQTAAQDRFLISNTGNVGIGSPAYSRLSVKGDSTGRIFEAITSASSSALWVSAIGNGTTTITGLDISGFATSTSNVGFNISTGCYAVNGTCLSGGSTAFGGGDISASSVTATTSFNTSGTSGGYKIDGNLILQASSTNFSTLVGKSAGAALLADGLGSTALGYEALKNATSSDYNTAVGYRALSFNTTGTINTANGAYSLYANTTGASNTANGYGALYSNTTGSNNTANGYASLYSNTTGSTNVANGNVALFSNTTGSNNSASGYFSLYYNTTGNQNIAYGRGTLQGNTTGSNNTATGYASLYSNITGAQNTASGMYSLYYATSSTYSTAIGYLAGVGSTLTASDYNSAIDINMTFLGALASRDNNVASTTALTNSTAIGYNAKVGGSNMMVLGNGVKVGIGTSTPIAYLDVLSTQGGSTPLFSIASSTSGAGTSTALYVSSNGFVGIGTTSPSQKLDIAGSISLNSTKIITLPNQTSLSGSLIYGTGGSSLSNSSGNNGRFNNLIGIGAGNSLTTGSANTATGRNAAYVNTTGSNWTATGFAAGSANTTGGNWTATGFAAGAANISASNWTANGYAAGYSNTSGSDWLADGAYAGYANTTGSEWTASGAYAGYSSTIGGYWVANGNKAGYSNTSGSEWTAVGYRAGYTNTTGLNWTAVGAYAGYSGMNNSNWTALGRRAGYSSTTGSDWAATGLFAGNNNTTGNSWTANGAYSGYNSTTGSNWLALGADAARYLTNGSTAANVYNNSVYVGASTKVSAESVTNENVFGYNATGNGSNSVTLGDSNVTKTIINGNLGLGTTTPSAKLSITQSANTSAGGLWIAETGNTDFRSVFMGTDGTMSFYGGDTAGTLNTATLNSSGAWTNASDRSYKENIVDLSSKYGLDAVLASTPRFYEMKGNHVKQVGFIAQELESIIPEVVDGKEGTKGISYGNLVAVAFQAIKDLNTKFENMFKSMFVKELHIEEKLCVEDVCIDKNQLKELLLKAGASKVKVEAPIIEEKKEEPIKIESPKVETSTSTATSTDITTATTTPEIVKVEEPKVEEKKEEVASSTPAVVEEPKKVEAPIVEEPVKVETPVVEAPKEEIKEEIKPDETPTI